VDRVTLGQVLFFSEYFGSPLSVSFSHCSTFTHLFITDAIQSLLLHVRSVFSYQREALATRSVPDGGSVANTAQECRNKEITVAMHWQILPG